MTNSTDIKKLTDEELVDLYIRTQSSKFFNPLFDRFGGKVYGKCLTLLKSEAAANDATQDIFIKVLLNLSKFKQGSRFSTWIYSITYNYCIDVIRKRKKMFVYELNETITTAVDEGIEEVSDAELLEIKVQRLNEILDKINPNEKMILLMKYQDGVSIIDIADTLKISESAVKMRLKRAKNKVVQLDHQM